MGMTAAEISLANARLCMQKSALLAARSHLTTSDHQSCFAGVNVMSLPRFTGSSGRSHGMQWQGGFNMVWRFPSVAVRDVHLLRDTEGGVWKINVPVIRQQTPVSCRKVG